MTPFLETAIVVAIALSVLAALLHLFPKLGAPGKAIANQWIQAPGLDLLILLFQIAPIVGGAIYAGWWGVLGGLVGMLVAYFLWVWSHEFTHRSAMKGPRIVRTMNNVLGGGIKGRFRNHAGVWATALALPIFWFIRAAEIFVYPLLILFLDFPRYKQSEWVNISRQKFDGLVGHDLIWCLYCDWMTGVYSLGAEMLRNVESFWCPIRFYPGKKCDNCAVDFPDVNKGWVPSDGSMKDVTDRLDEMYADGRREWFNHPARLTVEGNSVDG